MIATIREVNVASWKCVEKIGFQFLEKKLYKDINDKQPEMTRFYEMIKEKSTKRMITVLKLPKM